MDGKQALVLSGGSIEGAFQAGALSVILKSGDFWPRAIHGVSVGSLNGAYLADQAGRALDRGVSSLDWAAIGESLVGFWRENITSFKVIGETVDYGYWRAVLPFGALLIGNDILNHFRGIINSERLFRIIEDKIHGVNLKKSKEAVDFYAGYVDVAEGRFYEADGQNDHILDFIKASTIEPIMKPVYNYQPDPNQPPRFLADGGLRSLTPLQSAVANGAEELIIVVCQPLKLASQPHLNPRKLMTLLPRTTNIFVDGILQHDLETLWHRNRVLAQVAQMEEGAQKEFRRLLDWKPVRYKIVHPEKVFDFDIKKFDPTTIAEMIKTGKDRAREAMDGPWTTVPHEN